MNLVSRYHDVDDVEAAVEFCYEQGWTDGLPVVPPTRNAVERIIEYLKRDPQEVIGAIPPSNGVATIEKISINCVMAGCRPEYVPFVLSAVEAMLEEPFNLNGVQTTTHGCAPLVMISGPKVKEMNFLTREGAFGHGCRLRATIGRSVRLILWNIGGGYPSDPCKTTHGHPGYYSFCIAEDQESNPWSPMHVEAGFDAEDTVVTVTAVEAPHSIGTGAGSRPATDVLYVIASDIASLGSAAVSGGDMVLVLGPMAARNLADSGLSIPDVRRELMRLSTRPVHEVRHRESIAETHPWHWKKTVDASNENARVPFLRQKENIVILVSGGWGSPAGFCSLCPGWGAPGGFTVRRKVHFP